MIGFIDRLIEKDGAADPLRGEARIHRLNKRLNKFSIVFATSLTVFLFIFGFFQVAALMSVVAVVWMGTSVLLRRGWHDVGVLVQHSAGLTLIAILAVGFGSGMNGHVVFLLAASMPPLTWALKERFVWLIHLATAITLWAFVESGLLQGLAVVTVTGALATAMRVGIGLGIFVILALITQILIRENRWVELRLEASNIQLKEKINERERVESQLEEARDAAQRANRAKDDFLANMSHEIRTPMNTIIGLAGLCARGELAPRCFEYITRIRSSSRTLLGIINDILDLSRIEARELELEDVAFDLWEVLDHLTDLVGDKASAKGVEFLVSVDPDVPRLLLGDPLRLGQILTNLTNNAVKFTADGSVVVRVTIVKDQGDEVRLRFAVEDTGIGIPGHLIEGLFESFVQADGSTTRRFGGSGLGLTISKSLVELMDGVIDVESEVGKGSRFSVDVTFPRASDAVLEKLRPPRELEGLRVLVIAAESQASDATCSLLSSLGFMPRSAGIETGYLEALARAQDGVQPFGLVLVDGNKPSTGIDVCRRIAEDPNLNSIPTVVMVTSRHRDAAIGIAREVGIEGVLLKPLRAGAVLDVVNEAVGHDSSQLRRRLASSGFVPAVHRIVGSRILVAEDNDGNQLVAREILEDAGLEVTVVSNGEEAVREATEHSYDLVLMDVHMPRLDGPHATMALRADPSTSMVPIIAMTADALKETRARCFEAGMNDFVTKPISVSELLSKLVCWIGADLEKLAAPPVSAEYDAVAPEQSPALQDDDPPAPKKDSTGHFVPIRTTKTTWFSRLIGYGIPTTLRPALIKQRRLAAGLVLVLLTISAIYTPIYLAAGLPTVAAITSLMVVLWLVSYGLLITGWHRSGRLLLILVGIVGCAAYGLVLGPRANYHLLLLNGMTLAPMVFTFRERRLIVGCAIGAVSLWLVTELGLLVPFQVTEASDVVYALLHANAGLVCFGFIGFTTAFLARENYLTEDRLEAANERMREEITHYALAEKALLGAWEAAEEARLAKSDFLANMSHELRTPMNAILGLTELCLRSELETGVRDQVSRMQSAAQTLLQVVNDILDLSRLEARRIELERVDLDIDMVLDHLAGSVGRSASSQGLEFLAIMDPDVPRGLRGDPLRIEQVLTNLADNAVNATQKGEIVVRVERRPSDPASAILRFSVSDTGSGFPFDSIEELAETMALDDQSVAGRRPGSGLGLTISRSLVELLGGELQVSSKQGVGSTFWFEIELDRKGSDGAHFPSRSALAGTRALVLSQHPVVLDMTCRMLSSLALLPTAATTAQETHDCLRAAAEKDSPIQVIVIDWPNGGAEALEALSTFHRDAEGAPRLLLVTDLDQPGIPVDTEGTLPKPVRRSALFDAIFAVLDKGVVEQAVDEIPPDLRFAISRIDGARILVVEDNESNQLVARGILEEAGFQVDLVSTGREAVEEVTGSAYDLVLMDLHMPEMDGYEATRRIRENPDNADIPIVSMTADARQETRQACADAGMNGHVGKPVDRMELFTNLAKWIKPTNDGETGSANELQEGADKTASEMVFPDVLPGLDLREALGRMSGHRENLLGVLRSFERRFRGCEAEIEEAWRQGQVKRVSELTHLVKGLAGNISASVLFALSINLEQAIHDGDEASVPGLIKEQRSALDQVLASLKTLEQTLDGGSAETARDGSEEEVDLVTLRPLLDELIGLLASKSLRAGALFREINEHLKGSDLSGDLEAIALDLSGLEYSSARQKLAGLLQRFDLDQEGSLISKKRGNNDG